MNEKLPIAERIEAAITPVLSADGYELVLLEYVPRQKILRLYIDHERGVGIDDCSGVSRRVSDLLDAEGLSDAIDGHFNLEVSSPGLDRPLVKPKDFARYLGRKVNVTTKEPLAGGRRKYPGSLVAADEQGITVEVDGQVHPITYDQIDRARLVPEL